MKSKKMRSKEGFITTIVVILIAIVLLKFWFGVNIIDVLKTPKVSAWAAYLRDVIVFVWHYIADLFSHAA